MSAVMPLRVAVDGSAVGSNPGPAGWAWFASTTCWGAGGWWSATNNLAELTALLALLEATKDDATRPLHVFADSQYVINSVTKWAPGWRRRQWRKSTGEPVANVEVIAPLLAHYESRPIKLTWVRGHSGHPLNESADTLARGVATAFRDGRGHNAGPGYTG